MMIRASASFDMARSLERNNDEAKFSCRWGQCQIAAFASARVARAMRDTTMGLPALSGLPAAPSADGLAAACPPRAPVPLPAGRGQRTRAGKSAVTTDSLSALPEDFAHKARRLTKIPIVELIDPPADFSEAGYRVTGCL